MRLALLLSLLATSALADTLVVLPIAPSVDAQVAEAMKARRWNLAPAADVEQFLEENRVRQLDSLSDEVRVKLLERFGAKAVLTGSLLVDRNNTAGIAMRVIDAEGNVKDGDVVVWGSGVPLKGTSKAGWKPTLHDYRSASHPRNTRLRVVVLPFASPVAEASRVVLDILTVRLAAAGEFELVEPAELRDALRAEKLYSIGELTSAELLRVGKRLGTTAFLRGNVHVWRDAPGGRAEVQLDMTLADVETGEILWMVAHQRRGEEYAGLFLRGVVQNVVSLADRVVTEAIASQHRARLRTPGRKVVSKR